MTTQEKIQTLNALGQVLSALKTNGKVVNLANDYAEKLIGELSKDKIDLLKQSEYDKDDDPTFP